MGLVAAGVMIGQRLLEPLGDAAGRLESPEVEPSPDRVPRTDHEADDDAGTEFIEFRDEEEGFQILIPQGWNVRSVTDPQVRLLATPNDRDSVMVRIAPIDLDEFGLEDEVTQEDLIALHGFTEEIVRADEDVEVLIGPEIVELAGTASTYYLYTFEDGEERGAHAHYFVFEDDKMITLVLQALPGERFVELADVFDVVAESFSLSR